jgi:type VI secretion system secreted protein VgrG
MATYTQENRKIQVFTPLGHDVLLLQGLRGHEGISQLFHFELDLYSENRSISFDSIVGKNASVAMILPGDDVREINGVISSFSQGSSDQRLTRYSATLVPALWFLTQTSDCRIFQNMSVPDILKGILEDYGFTDYSDKLHGSYAEREYCVQYRETAFNFISRLMEEEGIFYFFEHKDGKHNLVFTDDRNEFKACPWCPSAAYQQEPGRGEQFITKWEVGQEVRPGKYSVTDFDFEKPKLDLTSTVDGNDSRHYEIYDYPGEYKNKSEGEHLVGVRMQEEDAPQRVINGEGTLLGFTSGYKFELHEHYRRDLNGPYVITSVQHAADLGMNFETSASESYFQGDYYENRFQCVPLSTAFRPRRTTPIPLMQGTQTAIVVGPAGEEIYVDKYGRVKVQFHWDRAGKYNEKSSCWIRVSQNWAGARWGAMFIPRIGQEVIVDFLEGDPDRPIITGRVYNGAAMPPYTLPDEMTKSTVKTYSSKGGNGFNELRFEDKKGSEQIFIHGEKNQDIRIKNDLMEWIGRDSHLIVKRDQIEKVEGDKHLQVKGDKNEKVDGTVSLKVGVDLEEKVGAKYALDAGTEVHIKAGTNLVLEAGTAVTLKVGGNFVNINPSGVYIKGTMVMINSGGSAGSGAGSSPDTPKDPLEADKAEPGEKIQLLAGKAPGKPVKYSPAAVMMRLAARDGMPFCDICG